MDFKNKKSLIAYYSRKGQNYVSGSIKDLKIGNTEAVAKMIQKETGADLFEIATIKDYPVDYTECTEVAQAELRAKERPKLTAHVDNMQDYDVCFIGFPNWWGTCPMPVFTFMEEYDFAGKTIIPFCTHEGSAFGRSLKDVENACKGATMGKGIEIHGTSAPSADAKVANWLKSM